MVLHGIGTNWFTNYISPTSEIVPNLLFESCVVKIQKDWSIISLSVNGMRCIPFVTAASFSQHYTVYNR